jgi:uncharacterized protein (TIGR00251 family)
LITVKVQPRSPKPGVEKTGGNEYKVRVGAAPDKGKANEELIEVLAAFFDVPKSSLRVLRGTTSRVKLISIEGERSLD